jgi:hypothetical protein
MKATCGLLAASAIALLACTPTSTPPAPSGGSAGAEGEAYCETVPTDPEDLAQWEELCQQQGRR